MRRGQRSRGGLVTYLLTIKQAIGIGAVLLVFYLTVPWGLLSVISEQQSLSSVEFTAIFAEWAMGFVDNILLIVLCLFVAVLTYGPEVLDLVGGPEGRNSRI